MFKKECLNCCAVDARIVPGGFRCGTCDYFEPSIDYHCMGDCIESEEHIDKRAWARQDGVIVVTCHHCGVSWLELESEETK